MFVNELNVRVWRRTTLIHPVQAVVDHCATGLEKGFSLIEFLIASLVTISVMGSAFLLSNMSLARQEFEQDVVSVQQTARECADQMHREIRLAGYPQQPLYAASLGWTAANSNKIASGFTTIDSSNLIFQGDIDDDGIVEVVQYQLTGTTLRRSEVDKNADGTVPAADFQTLAENVTGLAFTYYRWNGGGWTTSGVTAANVTRVDISLSLQTAAKDPQTKNYQNSNLQTSAIARNLQ